MMAADPELGKFAITARLFKLVSEMPKDQQLILLKQLTAGTVSNHLYKLVVEMTEEQQIILLEQMAKIPEVEIPERTVRLEEVEASMRENPRKACLINANYRVQDRVFKSYILDVSIGGVFVETNERFPVGKEVLLKFSLPNHSQPFTFAGNIAWSSNRGFGVKFDNLPSPQNSVLRSFLEQKE